MPTINVLATSHVVLRGSTLMIVFSSLLSTSDGQLLCCLFSRLFLSYQFIAHSVPGDVVGCELSLILCEPFRIQIRKSLSAFVCVCLFVLSNLVSIV